jgi:hypothetical protein
MRASAPGIIISAMMADATTILYRPVEQKELDLIAASAYRAFPPRLDWQPIFYPVLNEEYAPSSHVSGTRRTLAQGLSDMSSDLRCALNI